MVTDERIHAAIKLTNELLTTEKYFFRELVPSMLEDKLTVIYAIFDKD